MMMMMNTCSYAVVVLVATACVMGENLASSFRVSLFLLANYIFFKNGNWRKHKDESSFQNEIIDETTFSSTNICYDHNSLANTGPIRLTLIISVCLLKRKRRTHAQTRTFPQGGLAFLYFSIRYIWIRLCVDPFSHKKDDKYEKQSRKQMCKKSLFHFVK